MPTILINVTIFVLFLVFGALTPSKAFSQENCLQFYKTPRNINLKYLSKPLSIKHKIHLVSQSTSKLSSIDQTRKIITETTVQNSQSIEQTIYEHSQFYISIVRPKLSRQVWESNKINFLEINEAVNFFNKSLKDNNFGRSETIQNESGYSFIFNQVLKNLDFVLTEYKQRKQWPNTFLKELIKTAFQYIFSSTYISVIEKKTNGEYGRIIGSGRLISVPYFSLPKLKEGDNRGSISGHVMIDQALNNDTSGFGRDLEIDISKLHKMGIISNHELWQEIAGGNNLSINKPELELPYEVEHNMVYIPTPMENILNHLYPSHRESPSERVQYYTEPGNFSVIPDRELPEELKGLAAKAVYFHAARLIRYESGSQGNTTRIGTYASEGGASDKFYRYLTFKLTDQISAEQNSKNPTQETWNVLTEDGTILEKAFVKRFDSSLSAKDLEFYFKNFDSLK